LRLRRPDRAGAEARFDRGRIVDANGEGLAELPLFLVRDDLREPRRTSCDPSGWFRFDGVPHGSWKLCAGGAKSPIVPALALALDRERLELEPIALPPLGQVEVLVVDDSGHAVPSLDIHGQGDRGGEVHERTDALGKAQARFLPAGAIASSRATRSSAAATPWSISRPARAKR
jgi:hypothetical protein